MKETTATAKIDFNNVIAKKKVTNVTENISINDERTFITADKVKYEIISYYHKGTDGKPAGFISNKKTVFESKPIQVPLKEISLADVNRIRNLERTHNLDTNIFLFEEYPKFYVAKIPNNMSFMVTNIYDDTHLCRNCKHMSARPTAEGGCQKVIDQYKCLERYPFITIGYQEMGPGMPSEKTICICECSHYEEDEPRDIRRDPKFFMWKKSMHESMEALFRECF